jgi:hypothetical protein
MNYLIRMRAEFRLFSALYSSLPSHPYSPFYARWKTVLHLRLDLHRQQVQEAEQARELGVVANWKGWVLVEPTHDQPEQARAEVPIK